MHRPAYGLRLVEPPCGICAPCRYLRSRDADTVEISLVLDRLLSEPVRQILGRWPEGVFKWAVRLADCWAPEKHTEAGKRAAAFTRHVLEHTDDLAVHVEFSAETMAKFWSGQAINPLAELATFDRVVGHLYIDGDTTLSEMLVRAGHATVTKTKAA